MTRKATLPKISECIDPMPRVSTFTDARMLQSLAAFVLLGVLALAHVHLQFVRTDMKFQQHELQKRVCYLLQEEQRLQRANETFCDRARLASMASQEKMKEVDARQQMVAVVPVALRRKYEEPLHMPRGSQSALVAGAVPRDTMPERLMTLLDIGNANAASVPER
ncbi:MAG: hypothetical protein ACR2IE_12805 [Candidatus Sumerlaeaceae bacterium]